MSRVLAIDYGTKRTGLAVTDPLRLIATALATVPTHTLTDFLKKYFLQEDVGIIVVGQPSRPDGTDTHASPHVRGFVRKLQALFPEKEIHSYDERFTSVMARQTVLAAGLGRKDRRDKDRIDRVAATILLQSFLESRVFLKDKAP